MTNLEKLKTMTVKEIVAWLGSNGESLCPFACPPEHEECIDVCQVCWTHWFNAECEDANSTADNNEVEEDGVVFVAMSAKEFKKLKEGK